MPNKELASLSRRERQIMDIIYTYKNATAAEVRKNLVDKPSYSSVRTILRILCDKGHLRIEQDGPRYVYFPTIPQNKASRNALRHVIKTFFNGSVEDAVVALIEMPKSDISPEALDIILEKIEQNRKAGK